MKKFDINKWMKEQKDLLKDKKSPKPTVLTEAEIKSKTLLTEQYLPGSSEDNFKHQGFNEDDIDGNTAGYLYQCDGANGLTEIHFKADGIAHNLQTVMLPYVTFDSLNNTWTDADDGVDYSTTGTPLHPYFATSHHQIGVGSGGSYSGNENWVTPMDVIHYCATHPTFSIGWSDQGLVGTLDCSLLNGIDDCGGLWVGNGNHAAVILNPDNETEGGWSDYKIEDDGPWAGSLPWGYLYCQALNGGWDQSLCANSYYSPAALGKAAALANCQGASGACDDSWYKFGCVDLNSTNYNDIDLNSSTANFDGANWNYSSGGYSVDSNNYNVYVTGADANGYPTFTAGSTYASSWIDTNTLTVDGCAVNGIPDSDNIDCCNFIGCKATENTDSNFPIINRGLFSVPYQNSTAGLPILGGYDDNWITTNSAIIGCDDGSGTGNPADTTCCQVYGCPTSGTATMYGFGTENGYDANDVTTWTNIGQHGYDTLVVTVGCDSAGYIDPLDVSCCEPPIDSNIGCNNSIAINYNPTATGCVMENDAMVLSVMPGTPNPGYYVGQPHANLEHCCEYVGCDIAVEVPIGNYVYSNTDGSNPGPTNPLVPQINWGYLTGLAVMNVDVNGNSLGEIGCQDTMGGSFITGNNDCCITPNFGCPNEYAYNYDTNNSEGCSIDTNGVQIFENLPSPTDGSSCCEYIGCTDNAQGGLTVANYGIDSNNYPLLTLGGFNLPLLGILGGNTGCEINGDPNTNLFDEFNTECCNYYGCKDPIATNYFPQLSPDIDSNQVIDTPSLCTFGGCTDSSSTTITLANGTSFTYHLASNYDTQANGCEVNGTVDANNYDCCNYYDCGEFGAIGSQHIPTQSNHMIAPGDETPVIMTTGVWNFSGCPSRSYDMSDSNTWGPDAVGNWCCGYIGCPDNSINPLYGTGMYTGSDGYYNAKNFEGKVMSDYDSNYSFLGCDSNFTSEDCCYYEGCNDSTSANYYNTIFTATIDSNNISCEQGFNINDEIDSNTKECCQYLGCADPNAHNHITAPQGLTGCSFDTNGTIQADFSCCQYVGCPDVNANNYGTHASWDDPLNITGPGVGTDPNDGTWGCAVSDSNNVTTDTNVNRYICCNYNTGCPDSLAVQNTGIFTTYNVVGCPNGGCNYDSNAIACYSDTTYFTKTVPWITSSTTENLEGWGNIYDSNGNINPNQDNECCVYHWGCNDTNLNPFADPNAIGCYDENNPTSLPIMNVGEDNGNAGDPYRICCDPTFGCTDPNLQENGVGIAGSGFVQEAFDIGTACTQTNPNSTYYNPVDFDSNKIDSNEPQWCCTYDSIYACNDDFAIQGVIGGGMAGYTNIQYYDFLGVLAGTTLNFDDNNPPNNPSQADSSFWCSWDQGANSYGSDACYGALAVGCNPLDSNGFATNGSPYTNPLTGQDYAGAGDKNCCQYDYACPDANADNYWSPNNIGEFRVAGCSANKALDTNNPGKYIGPADPNDDTCCSYLNQLGCPDSLSTNYQTITTWSPNQGSGGCPENITPIATTQPLSNSDSNYDNCCSYTTGCPDLTADNSITDSLGCPDTNDLMYDGSFNYYPSGNPNYDTCCTYTSACAQQYDDSNFTNTNRTATPTGYNWQVPFSNYDPNNLGCDNNGTPDPTNVSCCKYAYGCIDTNLFNNGNIYQEPFDTNNVNSWGCNPSDSNSIAAAFILPDPNNNLCCGDPTLPNWNYQCNDPIASNFTSGGVGCADTNINHNANTPGTLLPDTNNDMCCTYVYGCSDSNATNFTPSSGLPSYTSPNYNGCHPYENNSDYWNNTCVSQSGDCYEKPSPANTDCCFYEYGCADPIAVSSSPTINGSGNNGPGCIDTNDAPSTYPSIWVTDPILETIGKKPNPLENSCCIYPYGCTDPLAIKESTLVNTAGNTNGIRPYFYDSNNLGCLDYSTPHQSMTDTGIAITVSAPPNDSNFDCCKYEYTCPDSNSLNYTGEMSNDGQGCAASSGFTTSGIDSVSYIKIDSNALQCCLYPTGCTDINSLDYDSNAMGCPSLLDLNGIIGAGSYLYNSDVTIGEFPNDSNTTCCGWGCDAYDSNNPNNISHPSTFITNNLSYAYDGQQGYAFGNSTTIDWWNAQGSNPAEYNGPETQVCCANKSHDNFSYTSLASWESALVPAPQGCDCEMLNTQAYIDDHQELVGQGPFVKVDCLMGVPECNKCCLNTELILDQDTLGTEINTWITSGNISPFDADDDTTWGPYMVPNLSIILDTNNIFSTNTNLIAHYEQNGGFCQCVDVEGHKYQEGLPWNSFHEGTVMEINCFSGYPQSCDVPCDSNDLTNCGCDPDAGLAPSQGIAPNLDHFQYGAASGNWLTNDTGDGLPSQAKEFGIHRAFCGPDYDNDGLGDHVCDTILEFSEEHCDCRFPCPGSPCDCYDEPNGVDWEEGVEYCCADIMTGEIDQSTATMPWAHAGNSPSNGGAGFMNCPTNPTSAFMHTGIETPCDAVCAANVVYGQGASNVFYYLHTFDTSGNIFQSPPSPGLIDTWECGCTLLNYPSTNQGQDFREATTIDPLGILYPAGTPLDINDPFYIGSDNQTSSGGYRSLMGCPDPTDPTKPAGYGNQHPTEDGMNDPYTHCCKLGITPIIHGCPEEWFGNYVNNNPLHLEIDAASSNWDPAMLSTPFGPNNQIYPEGAYQSTNYTAPGNTTDPSGTQINTQGSFCSFGFMHSGNQDDVSCCTVDFEAELVPGTDLGGGVVVGNMNQYGCWFNDERTNTSHAASQVSNMDWTWDPAGRGDNGPLTANETDPNEWINSAWAEMNNTSGYMATSQYLNENLIEFYGTVNDSGLMVYAPDVAWINGYNNALNDWISQGNQCPYTPQGAYQTGNSLTTCEFDPALGSSGIHPQNGIPTAIMSFIPVYIGSATNPSDNLDIVGNPGQFNPGGVAQGIQVGPPPSYNVTHTEGTYYNGPYPGVSITNTLGPGKLVYGPQHNDPSPHEPGVVNFDNFNGTPNMGTDVQPPAQVVQNTNFFPTPTVIEFPKEGYGLNQLYKTSNDPGLPHMVTNMINMTELMDISKYDNFKDISFVFNSGNNYAPGGVPMWDVGSLSSWTPYLNGNHSNPGEFYPINPATFGAQGSYIGTMGNNWYGSLAFNKGEGPHWSYGWKGCYPGAKGSDVSCCQSQPVPPPGGEAGSSGNPGYMNSSINGVQRGWYFPGMAFLDEGYTNYPWPYGGTANSPVAVQQQQIPNDDGTLDLNLNAAMCKSIDFNNSDAMSELFASLEKEREKGGEIESLKVKDTNISEQEELETIDTNLNKLDKKELDRLDRSVEFYDQLIAYCKDLTDKGIIDSNADVVDSNLITSIIPEYCLNLPIDSPYLNPNSDECKKCSNKKIDTNIGEQEEPTKFGTEDTNMPTRENPTKDLCACCEAPVIDTNIVNVIDSNALDSNNIKIIDSNALDPNMFVLDSNMIRIIDSNETPSIDSNIFIIDSNLIKPVKPVDTNIIGGETEEEKAEREERERLEKEKRDKEKEEKFQKDLNKYYADIEAHKNDDWLEGKGDHNDLKSTLNHPDGYTQYFFFKKVDNEDEKIIEKDFLLPTQEPKITKEELKRMVKNAIREIKRDLKNKR